MEASYNQGPPPSYFQPPNANNPLPPSGPYPYPYPYPTTTVRVEHHDYGPLASGINQKRIALFAIGVILAAVAAVAAYYTFSHGLRMLDHAHHSNVYAFGGGTLAYMGFVFSCVSVANLGYVVYKLLLSDKSPRDYTAQKVRKQVGLSLFAPIILLPVAMYCALAARR